MIINNKSLKYRRCPLCNSNIDLNNNDILFINKDDNNLERYIISQCQECNLIHQNPSYSEDYYNNLYSDLIYDPVAKQKNYNPEHVKRYNSIFSVINNFIKDDTSRVLDFGCYNGSFVKWIDQNNLLPKNITIEGYDSYGRITAPMAI